MAGMNQTISTTDKKIKNKCKYFNSGYCKFQNDCKFMHPETSCRDKQCQKRHAKPSPADTRITAGGRVCVSTFTS